VFCCRGTDGDGAYSHALVRRKWLSMRVPTTSQPACNGWRGEQGNIIRERVEAREREMVSMGMCQQKGINRGKISEQDTGSAHSREETPETRTKVRVRENADARQLQQERGVAYVSNP
jgi:hypothetical protein